MAADSKTVKLMTSHITRFSFMNKLCLVFHERMMVIVFSFKKYTPGLSSHDDQMREIMQKSATK